MNTPAFTRRIRLPFLTRPAAIVAVAAIIVGGGSAAALASTSRPHPPGTGFVTVSRTVHYPARTGQLPRQEFFLACPSTADRAISGSIVPTGLVYDATAAANGEYRLEWSGLANFYTWDWYFYNGSSKSISMTYVVTCQA